MNTRDYNFLLQAAIAANDGYKYHMLYDGLEIEIIGDTVLFGDSRRAPSKSEGDDLILKTTPRFNL